MKMNQALIRRAAKSIWYRPGKVRTCFSGPYSGIHFELAPALMDSRMAVFYKAYEPEVTELLERIVRPGKTVFDVGAHIGVHTLYMCKLLRGTGKVFAFEPWVENLADLVHNLRCNSKITRVVTPVAMAIGEHTHMANFDEGGSDGRHHFTDAPAPTDRLLPMVTLDSFCADTSTTPDIIKIDIEGQELNALKGAREVLLRYRPQLVLEHHRIVDELRCFLTQLGYAVAPLGERHLYAHVSPPA